MTGSGANGNTPAQAVSGRMAELRDEFVDFISQLVLEESPSTEPEAQRGIRAILTETLDDIGLEVEHIPGQASGGHLLARGPGAAGGRAAAYGPAEGGAQLLVGHMDTVWPIGTLREMPMRVSGGRLSGPGAFDMKTGLAIGVFALRALRDVGLDAGVSPVFVINSDEEIGSPESEPLIRDLARGASRAFVLEPALGPRGRLKTRRKGIGQYHVAVGGRSSHAGLAPEEGASAILQLAHTVREIDRLGDAAAGTTVNVGLIGGGSRPNVVAASANCEVDVRAWTAAEADRIREGMFGLEPTVPGTRIRVTQVAGRGPLERTPRNVALWERALRVADEIGLELREGSAGGGSDGNLTSQYTATLDGLGAVGDGAHARHEFVWIDRAVERVALLAGLIADP
ncbi:M20 family metallopeptidase [Candidatus Palauibacter polyketidifaciens]|uniref:M20 family metallopeptidase n=1 Tax=Candidatus Palauibacter polyketidifaciens TaxID=3056740 RepID=UPI00139CF20F|nr:M20 family metallopeptidase [Candidatus Palauibacter polyketidifaciens]MDE2719502.1 M20 family metallopeptidase [Candidatus Palauibacter polyketidifaciens]MYE34138.1 M20 family metallopeptidase [Gemmatimonadales bacterium]